MKKEIRIIAAALAAFFMLPLFGAAAYAAPEEYEVVEIIEEVILDEAPQYTPRPFTPSGTGTVVDFATDAEGKDFYTIVTPDENVFYLIIDRQRNAENVYFLNAVTEADLLPLAKMPESPAPTVTEQPPASAAPPEPTIETPSMPEQPGGGIIGMIIALVAVILMGGGAGWYFKIYRPKQRQHDSEEEYPAEEHDQYDDYEQDAEPEYDAQPWYDEEPGEDGGE